MAINIGDDVMTLEVGGQVISQARRPGDWWEVSYWPRFFDRDQAITALTVTELLETGRRVDDPAGGSAPRGASVTDRLIRITTAMAVAGVAAVAAIISYRHAYELVRYLRRDRPDGAADSVHCRWADPGGEHADPGRQLAEPAGIAAGAWARRITATVGANLAHGLGHGPIGALVSAWPALALAGSFELLMTLIRTGKAVAAESGFAALARQPGYTVTADVPAAVQQAPDLEQTIRDWHGAGHSQRAIARELNIDRRKVKRAITSSAA